ncbi:MAG: hypothetical protein L6R41_001667 [Letrouitia leprolyta]|nr:MAG: hypothetical protein L6R41_001667 [Letrouitia leprolyta]
MVRSLYPLVTIYLLLATLWALLLVQVLPQTTFGDDLAATGLLGDHFEIPGIHASYDYIIVGGGTAGITLARRLAANTSVTVALIEAGGFYESDNCNRSQIPADATSTTDQTRSFSESAFLREVLGKSTNLQGYKSTVATRVIFDASKIAVGVEVQTGGFSYQLNAQKEVILSAGTSWPEYVAFEKLSKGSISASTRHALDSTFGPDWPNIELVPFDNDLVSLPEDGRNYVSSLIALVAPFSRGNVTIHSTSTLDNPIVSPNWLTDPRDVEIAIAGFKRARQIFNQSGISGIINGGTEFSPAVNVTSDSKILRYIRDTSTTISHAAGTCRMGIEAEQSTVVDSRCRVIGVQGLRVVDASVFPVLPPGHPQGTIQDIPLGKRLYQYRSGVQALPDTYCLLDQFLFSVSAILAEV